MRLSGPRAFEIAARLFSPSGNATAVLSSNKKSVSPCTIATRQRGLILIESARLDASAWLFPESRSATGQPVIEFHLIGSPVILGMLIEALIENGARRAEAGEFTARAFLSGRIDLSQAHGVAGMIAARSDRQLRAAERLLHGELGRVALESREALADLLSLVEGAMDFADEPIDFITAYDLRSRIDSIRMRLRATADAGVRAERWGRLPRVVMTGLPNAGKSTLLNRLSGTERAISTAVEGTTRDAISVAVELGSATCLLVDVAGHRSKTGGGSRRDDDIDTLAAIMAFDAAADADALLLIVDLAASPPPNECTASFVSSEAAKLVVGNQSDRASAEQVDSLRSWSKQHGCEMVAISALTGVGCDELRKRLQSIILETESSADQPIIALMADHREALESALAAIDRAATTAAQCDAELRDADLVAAELRIAAESLGVLVGMDQTEDMLGRVFSRFCVGK